MKGTIDPVDAIFSAFGGVWGRIFCFGAVSLVGFALGVVAFSSSWDAALELAKHWPFVPASWIVMVVGSCFAWWGIPHLLALLVLAYRLVYLEASMSRTLCVLFLMESWFAWSLPILTSGPGLDLGWRPLLPVLLLLSVGAAWLWWRSWKMDHPAEEEPCAEEERAH